MIPLVLLVALVLTKCLCSQEISILVITSSQTYYNTTTAKTAITSAISDMEYTAANNSLEIVYNYEDTKCNENQTEEIIRNYLQTDPRPVVIIGCGCPSATKAAMNLSLLQQYGLPVVSYDLAATFLQREVKHQLLFRTIPTFDRVHDALLQLFDLFEWRNALLISEDINLDSKEFVSFFLEQKISLATAKPDAENIFEDTHRVFIIDGYSPNTRRILCEAHKEHIYYPSYAWLIFDNFINDDWFAVTDTNCTVDQILRVLNHSIVIETLPGNDMNDISNYAYDATMAVVMASIRARYSDSISDSLKMVSFTGKSGKVSFGNGSANEILFKQLITNNTGYAEKVIGVYAQSMSFLNTTESIDLIWPFGIPSDGDPIIVIETVKTWAFASSVLISCIGMVCVVICFIFIFMYRKAKLIKLTSPKLNYFLLFGTCSVFLSIILYSYPSTDVHVFEALCPIQPFFGSILGYDLCVTITTIKLWRIYYIFKGPHPGQQIPKDWQLLTVIGVLLSFDTAVSILLIVVDVIWFPPMLIHENKPDSFNPLTGEVHTFYFWDCRYSTYIFTLIALIHNLVVHGIGIWFAFKLRKIQVTVLNEYRYNLAILFSSIAITIITAICLWSIGPDPSLYAFIYCLFVTIGCLTFVGLTFIPKVIALIKDPNGENLFPETVRAANNVKDFEKSVSSGKLSSVKQASTTE